VTAARRARTILDLEDDAVVEALEANPARLDTDDPPVLIDEWQRYPRSWDLVRRSVDRNNAGGAFSLPEVPLRSTRRCIRVLAESSGSVCGL
jgi:uncharacterized protein